MKRSSIVPRRPVLISRGCGLLATIFSVEFLHNIPTGRKLSLSPLGPLYWIVCLDLVVGGECRK
jgi:hypothetical protein